MKGPSNVIVVKSPRRPDETTNAKNTDIRDSRRAPASDKDDDESDDEVEEIHTSRRQFIYAPHQPSPYFDEENGTFPIVPGSVPPHRGHFVFLGGDKAAVDRVASMCFCGMCCLLFCCVFIPLGVVIGLLISVLLK